MKKTFLSRALLSFSIPLLFSSCLETDATTDGNSITNPLASGASSSTTEAVPETTSADTQVPLAAAPSPVNPNSIPESGEFTPDPVLVLYHFIFQDGTQVKFREDHVNDHWGKFPEAGFGQIIWPDGRVEAFGANRKIRHGGLSRAKTPVTTLSHGRRLFWMADAEERKDVKKVTIFEDGWNPLVEGSLLATQGSLGINSPLVECVVKVERRK